jgi:DNA replication protein DnaC
LIPTPEKPLLQTAEPCPMCNGAGFFRLDVPVGHPQFGKPQRCDHPSHNGERVERVAKMSGLDKADMKKRLKDIKLNPGNRDMLEAAQEIIAGEYGLLFIWGGPGNAKSEALISIANELRLRGKATLYTKLSRVIEYMREAYSELKQRESFGPEAGNLGYIDRFERLKKIQVLAIDEMDKIRSTPFAEEFCFDFLDERYNSALRGESVTVFASNTDPAEFPPAIYDRLRDGRFKIVHNTAASARPRMKRNV